MYTLRASLQLPYNFSSSSWYTSLTDTFFNISSLLGLARHELDGRRQEPRQEARSHDRDAPAAIL
jgi:hypothetical protein